MEQTRTTALRRNQIRGISFLCALFLALGGFGVQQFIQKQQYRIQVAQSYERALADLTDYLDQINVALQKGLYVTTPTQISMISAQLWREAGGAKMSLSQLPLGETDLDDLYRFLSQVGDYSMTLSKRLISGESITDSDRLQLQAMSEYASALSNEVQALQGTFNGEDLVGTTASNTLAAMSEAENETNFAATLAKNAEAITGYPTLIYDGPFSDHILQRTSSLTKDAEAIGPSRAKTIAAQYLQMDENDLSDSGEENGNLPCYTFSDALGNTAAVTKAGGYCVYINKTRAIGTQNLGFEDALEKAEAYLASHQFNGFTDHYYMITEGVCVINFAYTLSDVICYPDLIKVGVALDTGEIVSMEARTYVMNHHERTISTPSHTVEEAAQKLSPLLQQTSYRRCIVLTSGLQEVDCYEFTCQAVGQEQEILVYINTQTLQEEFVFLLIKTDGGILTQ